MPLYKNGSAFIKNIFLRVIQKNVKSSKFNKTIISQLSNLLIQNVF